MNYNKYKLFIEYLLDLTNKCSILIQNSVDITNFFNAFNILTSTLQVVDEAKFLQDFFQLCCRLQNVLLNNINKIGNQSMVNTIILKYIDQGALMKNEFVEKFTDFSFILFVENFQNVKDLHTKYNQIVGPNKEIIKDSQYLIPLNFYGTRVFDNLVLSSIGLIGLKNLISQMSDMTFSQICRNHNIDKKRLAKLLGKFRFLKSQNLADYSEILKVANIS
jgi:hypothetical protein